MVKPYDESMKKFVGANIYLINDGTIEEPPLLWELSDGTELLKFHYGESLRAFLIEIGGKLGETSTDFEGPCKKSA